MHACLFYVHILVVWKPQFAAQLGIEGLIIRGIIHRLLIRGFEYYDYNY